MSDSVTITLELCLNPDTAEAFCAGLQESFRETAKFAGFQKITVVKNQEDPHKILFIENWESEMAYKAYVAWRASNGDMDGFAAMLAGPPKLSIWPTIVAAA